jgi:hypothetical protein
VSLKRRRIDLETKLAAVLEEQQRDYQWFDGDHTFNLLEFLRSFDSGKRTTLGASFRQ